MPKPARARAPALDDRSPFEVALAAVDVIARHSELGDQQAVLDEIVAAIGPAAYKYVTAISRTSHSVFYYQLQSLYEFGKQRVVPEERDGFCRDVGATFASRLLAENFRPLERVALASDTDFQKSIVEVVSSYFAQYTGKKYVLSTAFEPDHVVIAIRYRSPTAIFAYLDEYGLLHEVCFRNSAEVLAGAVDYFASQLTASYDHSRFRVDVTGLSAEIRVPVGVSDRFNYETLLRTLTAHMRALRERQEETVVDAGLRDDLILDSPVMRERWDRVRRASRTDELILLQGESGTGKSVMARKIHELSARRDKAFVEVDLTADVGSESLIQSNLFGHEKGAFTGADRQKQGLFSLADAGTIFLDEIGDATPEVQAKLLRVLESSRFRRLGGVRDLSVDVRVIAATNRDLEAMVEAGEFRSDLYYRLNVIAIHLPPLRDHPEDIPALAHFLFGRARVGGSLSTARLPDAVAGALVRHPWTGNIRELDHALRHAAALAEEDEIRVDDFPPNVVASLLSEATSPEDHTAEGEPSVLPAAPVNPPSGGIIDDAALRCSIRSCNPLHTETARHTAENPAHIDFARRAYLSALIDELGGDLAAIGFFWDRASEKTLRNQIRKFGLTEALKLARQRRKAQA